MMEEIRIQLQGFAEADYKEFNQKLLPGVGHVMGVRTPALRKLARAVAKESAVPYLEEAKSKVSVDSFYEEIMLQGFVLGYARFDIRTRTRYLDEFVPKIQNWGVCDGTVTGFKFMQKDPDYWYDYIKKYENSQEEFELRFLFVSMLAHFVDERHIDDILETCGKVRHDGYYVKMGAAWLISVCYVRFPEQTRKFLENNQMDDFTHNKSIQKIRESYRVSREEKEALNQLKRKAAKHKER